jgi:acyl-CoA thioesterase-2
VRFEEMMDLAPHGPDTFVGTGPVYPWGGLFGGQIVAQSLRAAAATVAPEMRPHSLHAYFIRTGNAAEPIRFEVDRTRDGRSFFTRAVVARQAGGVILQMVASFQRDRDAEQVQTATPPEVPSPDELADDSWTRLFSRRKVSVASGRATGWLRIPLEDPSDPVLAACALAYLSDDLATDSVNSLYASTRADGAEGWHGISLDHAIWFQADLDGGAWQLHDVRCDGLLARRGLSMGHVFDQQGAHLATVAQEVLLRGPAAASAPESR